MTTGRRRRPSPAATNTPDRRSVRGCSGESPGYGFASLEGVELHLGVVTGEATPASAYLFVEDADSLARSWAATGADIRTPQDTDWGQHEGVVIDPDDNVIRFGSPMA